MKKTKELCEFCDTPCNKEWCSFTDSSKLKCPVIEISKKEKIKPNQKTIELLESFEKLLEEMGTSSNESEKRRHEK